MRRLRSTTALLALVVTAWSNLTAFPCGGALPGAGGDVHLAGIPMPGHRSDGTAEESTGPHHGDPGAPQGAHAAHHASALATTSGADEEPPPEHAGRECAVLMACAAAARATPVTLAQALLAPAYDDATFATIAEPSAADRTQDPPPPRRHA